MAEPPDDDAADGFDWVAAQRAHLRPVVVGRFGIHPPWLAPVGEIPVAIDPGPTFGHGAHPTTALCLARIDELVGPGTSVLDIGCGSGVLAIAAARLGAAPVVGVDIDPAAVEQSGANARANRVRATFSTTPVTALAEPGDVTVANMLPSALLELADDLVRLTRRHLVVSGIPADRGPEVAPVLAAALGEPDPAEREGWVSFTFTR